MFPPSPGGGRPHLCRTFSASVVTCTSIWQLSPVSCCIVFILNSSNIFITSLQLGTNSLNGSTSEPLSGYLCSWKAQLQAVELDYFCVHIHQAEIPRVNSSDGLQQLCRITDVECTAGPVLQTHWMLGDPQFCFQSLFLLKYKWQAHD